MRVSHRVVPWIVFLVAGSALVFDPWGWQPFGASKWLVITGAAWAGLAAALSRVLVLHRGSLILWTVTLGWVVVTTLWAVDPLAAVVGSPDRRLGLVGVATMAAGFVAGQAVTERSQRRTVARSMTVVVVAMGIYGVAEAAGIEPVALTTTSGRLGSTFGSPAYLGASLCLLIPVSLGLALDDAEARGWKRMALVGVLAGVFLLFGSATRAALVGLAGAALVATGAWWPRLGSRHRGWAVAAAVGLVGLLAVSPFGERIFAAGDDPLATSRIDEWAVAATALLDRPLLGAGLEGYRVVFPEAVDIEYVRAYGRATVTDRAHSGPLDVGVSLGFVGVGLWLVAAAWIGYRAWVEARRGDGVLTGMALAVAALLIQELFLFPTIEVGVAGWAIAGMVIAARPKPDAVSVAPHRLWRIGVVVVAAALTIAGLADVAADHLAARALRTGDVAVADTASELRPDSFRYRLAAADVAMREGNVGAALRRVESAVALSPNDPAVRLSHLRVLAAAAELGEVDVASASRSAEEAVASDPNNPALRMAAGAIFLLDGDVAAAEHAWLAAEALSPDDPAPPLRLARLYIDIGDHSAARAAVVRAATIAPGDPRVGDLEENLVDD